VDGADAKELDGCQCSPSCVCKSCTLVVLDLRSPGLDTCVVSDVESEEAVCQTCKAAIPVSLVDCRSCRWSINENWPNDACG
jgi:ribosomal protein L40E